MTPRGWSLALVVAIALWLVPAVAVLPAQSTATSQKFDVVVSIRACRNPLNTPGYMGSGSMIGPDRTTVADWNGLRPQLSPGHVLWICEPLEQLVFEAYAGRDHPLLNTAVIPLPGLPAAVRGGPSWAHTDSFTIEAKGEVISAETLAPILRSLLEDHFQLKVRRVTEPEDVYVMTVAKGGINAHVLQTPTPGDCVSGDERRAARAANPQADPRSLPPVCGGVSIDAGKVTLTSFTTQQLATQFLRSRVGHYVIDQTGVDSTFNLTMHSPSDPAGDDSWIIRALAQAGLKLTLTKAPAEHLQIDHAEKPKLE